MIPKTFVRGFILTLWVVGSVTLVAQSGSLYDPKGETIVAGTILHSVSFPAPDGTVGVHFDLQSPSGMVNVHVAPAMYIGMNNFSFFADDQVEMIGVTVWQEGNKSFIARFIKKDGKTLRLRDPDGTPVWSPAVEGTDGCGVAHPGLPRGTER